MALVVSAKSPLFSRCADACMRCCCVVLLRVCAQIADLKAWVTDNSLEDDEFFKLSQNSKTKKVDWVKYVNAKLAAD